MQAIAAKIRNLTQVLYNNRLIQKMIPKPKFFLMVTQTTKAIQVKK
jgi:hypothetical protein